MPSLDNSKRTLFKATYVPTQSQAKNLAKTSRVVQKTAYLRGLAPTASELNALTTHKTVGQLMVAARATSPSAKVAPGVEIARPAKSLIELTRQLVTKISPLATQENAAHLATVSGSDLVTFGRAIAALRRTAADTVAADVQQIISDYQQAHSGPPATVTTKTPPFTEIAAWAHANNSPAFDHVYQLALANVDSPLTARTMNPVTLVATSVNAFRQRADTTDAQVDSFLQTFQTEQVGRLHLERLEMTPVGIEHGELVHSVPLTPKETINITHREWSVTSRTFEDIVQDSLDNFSEKGVIDKTDLTQATDNESRHSSSLDVNGSVSASYNGGSYSVTASAAVDYNTKSDDLKAVKSSYAHSQAITKNASSRSKKEHKTSFRVSSVSGAEDLSVQVLTNPSDTNAMRVDYFQLLRKWRVDLVRYGLRMTYDLVVPNPGLELIEKVYELDQLKQAVRQDFIFDLQLSQITPTSYLNLAAGYNAEVDLPPSDPFQEMQSGSLQKSIDQFTFATMELDVPDGYIVTSGHFTAQVHIGDGDFGSGHRAQINLMDEVPGPGSSPRDGSNQFLQKDGTLEVDLTQNTIVNRTGKVSLMYNYYNVESGGYICRIQASPTVDTVQAWQVKAWNALRAAALAAFNQQIARMNDRIAQLDAEIKSNDFDALTLRRMEREAIMKCVLQWLFGPTFKLVPDVIQGIFDQLDAKGQQLVDLGSLSGAQWQTVMQFGQFIEFIHNAIEWENVLFFSYPYFWDSIKNWPFKRFLVHPDPEHRGFLRAGAARVVLTIRPGFEHDFANFLEYFRTEGDINSDSLQSGHPYISIADEIRNFAMTNYEGIPPANPDDNARVLLYPEQQKTWNDMQKIITLLEDYNTARHQLTYTSGAIAAGKQIVNPASMDGIEYGTTLTLIARDQNDPNQPDLSDPNQETVTVADVTKTTFTATFNLAHGANSIVIIDSNVKMYPPTSQFPAALQAFANTKNLPLRDYWGRLFQYTSPGLHGDYDLVSYGRNGAPGYSDPPAKDYPVDLDADITSWAEGSVVSRWYEYTPTSALDVSINTVLPTEPQPA